MVFRSKSIGVSRSFVLVAFTALVVVFADLVSSRHIVLWLVPGIAPPLAISKLELIDDDFRVALRLIIFSQILV